MLGLKLGADDYITKPFGFMELLARAEAVLRRARPSAPAETYRFADVIVDFRRHEASRRGELIDLSPREFQLLAFFIQHRGEVINREKRPRRRLGLQLHPLHPHRRHAHRQAAQGGRGQPLRPRHIVTVHRLGYKFNG